MKKIAGPAASLNSSMFKKICGVLIILFGMFSVIIVGSYTLDSKLRPVLQNSVEYYTCLIIFLLLILMASIGTGLLLTTGREEYNEII